mmetsp:Transcript_2/g.2  ORF Transcript_2/g.2 Transcript_2/m.2 type:complete len:315 (-) Transcript_2:27-971(-)
MKGKSYVPSAINDNHLEWHWNDGIYTFGNRKDIEQLEETKKPWEDDEKKHVYVWKASVPREWYRFKSPESFVSIKESGKSSTTLEFLGSTQKYIHQICHHGLAVKDHPVHKKPKVVYGRASSVNRDYPEIQPMEIKTHRLAASVTHFGEKNRKSAVTLPPLEEHVPKPSLPNSTASESYKVVDLVLEGGQTSPEDYKITKYALPKGLTSLRRRNKEEQEPRIQSNHKIDDFLTRFEKPHKPADPPKVKLGMDGWKLAKARSPLKKLKRRVPIMSPTSTKATRDFESERFESTSSEVYLEYLNYKRGWVGDRAMK